jgi:S1-C subfamily serine protease
MGFNPMRQAAVAAALAGAFGLCALLAPSDSEANMNKEQRKQIMLRTVFMLSADFEGNDLVPISRGSGTVVTPDGAVLTNHHVVWNEQKKKPFDVVIVGVTDKFDEKPVYRCMTFPKNGVLKEELDLALVKCETDMDGKPWKGNDWPAASIGSSEDLVPGDDVVVIGYPGIGGWTINYTTGKVSGFIGADGGAGRFWIKTDADIASGNSGGSALDEDGNLIGVPSAVQFGDSTAKGRVGLVRPIELGRDLINLAKSGWTPGPNGGSVAGSPPAANNGFGGSKSGAQTQEAKSGVNVIGQVKAVDNDTPVHDALVIVLKPGVRVKDVTKDNIGQKYQTKATTNGQGQFQLESPVPRDKKFSVIVIADGFEPLFEDNVLSTEGNVPDRYDPWGTITLKRE